MSVCQHKSAYNSEYAAEIGRRYMAARHPAFIFKSYQCPGCGHWHVGRAGTMVNQEWQQSVMLDVEVVEAVRRLKKARGW